jgi:soluble lytic murein transglycosylase-like protein/TolA-binding protein
MKSKSANQGSSYGPVWRLVRAASVLCLLAAVVSCSRPAETPVAAAPAGVPVSAQDLALLFAVASDGDAAPNVDAILGSTRNASRTDPNWPVLTYLAGEARLQRKDVAGARSDFRDLAVWSVLDRGAGPYKDGKGGSGLAVVALWRWLQILAQQGGSAQEVEEALSTAALLQRSRLFGGMVSSGLLPALPLMEEDIARRLAHVAAAAKRPDAMDLFLAFMSLDSTGEFNEADQRLRERIIDEEMATPERLDLYQLRRQVNRVRLEERKRQSAEQLRQLWENQFAPTEVRAEAGYEWSNYYRSSDEKKKDVVATLSSVYELAAGRGSIAERALYLRGMVENRGRARNPAAFFADMDRLLERFPKGRMVDDALYQVATEHLLGAQPDPERAFSYFEKLRAREDSNDYLDSAYVLAAIGMVDRGTDADLKEADRLLAAYVQKFPDGPFRLRSLFWRGRIAERGGDAEAAQRLFQQIIAEAPYDYYGVRARMHLENGVQAVSMNLPAADSRSASELRAAFRKSAPEASLAGGTPYHARLRAAEQNGTYARSREIVDGLGRRFRNRLDNIALADLDEQQLIPAAAVLLALRQDATAARDSDPTPGNQLQLAAFLGRRLVDWPVAIMMADVRADGPHERIGAMQNDPRFLATLYPADDVLRLLKVPLAEAAWPIDGSAALSQSLMYAVIRRESAFYASAISPVGAIGLFQIMPATFEGRKDCWKPQEGQKPTPASYLFDPERNTLFWSCWVGKEFKPRKRDQIAMMLVQHHAGRGNLLAWQKGWKGRAIESDLELQIESFRFPATRLFVQRTLTDAAIVDASGLFGVALENSGKPGT